MIWDQGGRVQGVAMTLRSEVMIKNGHLKMRWLINRGVHCICFCWHKGIFLHALLSHFCHLVQVTDYQMAVQLVAEAINGPTTQGGLRPFSWHSFNFSTHQGLPHTYNFPFVTMRPTIHHPWQNMETEDTIPPDPSMMKMPISIE